MSLRTTRELLGRVRERTDRILVGMSGGKDSIVTLDVCVDAFGAGNVECFFMRLVPNLRVEMTPLETVCARYKVKLHTLPHWNLSQLIRRSFLRHNTKGANKTPVVKQKDVELALKARTGIRWIAYGHRQHESLVRLAMLRNNGGFDLRGQRVYPIHDWATKDVYAWMRRKRVPIPRPIAAKKKGQSGGIDLTPFGLCWLEAKHPDDFARLTEMFPLAPSAVFSFRRDHADWRELIEGGHAQKRSPQKPREAGRDQAREALELPPGGLQPTHD